MVRPVYAAVIAAALAAAGLMAIPKLVNASAPAAGQKADLADLTACEPRSWPYYARACVRDETRNAGRAINVRIVALDRLRPEEIKAASGPAPVRLSREALLEAASPVPLSHLVAPSSWMMSYDEARLTLDAGDFIRRTVPQHY
ncbi:hypothetical protein [Pseudorhodoplanes sp.]|uniref:hypothetical protein n=1 Tax=Pseudorhodoplanes sp. TaxID=1934341 RepID=UPI002CFCC180|nr:hypothetical protein [Pseudorhodoplanes sp.]HWV41609.1 hypothetical protein [Pseudorhodoplanes sp.]